MMQTVDKETCTQLGALIGGHLATALNDSCSPEERDCAANCCDHLAAALLSCCCGHEHQTFAPMMRGSAEDSDDEGAVETFKNSLPQELVEKIEDEFGAPDWGKIWAFVQKILPLILPLFMKTNRNKLGAKKPVKK